MTEYVIGLKAEDSDLDAQRHGNDLFRDSVLYVEPKKKVSLAGVNLRIGDYQCLRASVK